MNNTRNYIIAGVAAVLLAACSPRVDDIFDTTAVNRLEQNREEVMNRLISEPNGWVMEYFPQSGLTGSANEKQQGYTFLIQFNDDKSVVVGAPDPKTGKYKTETSLWDIINDNSSVLTFNTFNSIFHYYSNPDPALGLWGADGTGVGGDYEFMVLQYNEQENYQLLKGKKRSTYDRLYPLPAGQDWENYFLQIKAMDDRLFSENAPLDMYVGNRHFTLYNGKTHEFRAFKFGADTLGGGTYYGFIVTPKGIRLHETVVLETAIDDAPFILNAEGSRLVSTADPSIYMTVEGGTAFLSDAANAKPWAIEMGSLPASVQQAINTVNANISALVANSYIASLRFEGAGKNRIGLKVFYSVGGAAANSYDIYYFDAVQEGSKAVLTADGTYSAGSILYQYGANELVALFNGEYSFELIQGFAPSKGIVATKSGDAAFTLRMTH